jgi:hypothetical protein
MFISSLPLDTGSGEEGRTMTSLAAGREFGETGFVREVGPTGLAIAVGAMGFDGWQTCKGMSTQPSSSTNHTALQIALRCSWMVLANDSRDAKATIIAYTCQKKKWMSTVLEICFKRICTCPNVIAVELVGLVSTVDWIHMMVGVRMRYTNLNTGALSMTFDLRFK